MVLLLLKTLVGLRSMLVYRFGENWGKAVNESQQKLNSHLQDSAEFLKRCWQQGAGSNSSYLAADCFPPRLVTAASQRKLSQKLSSSEDEQLAVCTGSRTFLNVKLYDIAVYMDPNQVNPTLLPFAKSPFMPTSDHLSSVFFPSVRNRDFQAVSSFILRLITINKTSLRINIGI